MPVGGGLGYGCGVGRTVLRVFEAAKNAGAGAGNEQKQRCDGRSLQAGKVVQDALAQKLIPALGRQSVERFVEAQVSAGDKIRIRLDDGMRVGEHFERQNLLALLLALRAGASRAARAGGPDRQAAPHRLPSTICSCASSQFIVTSFKPQNAASSF